MTPWAWGGGGAKLQLAGNRGWFPVWKGRGRQRGAGTAPKRHTPAFLPPSPPFCWKSEVIVRPGWGGLDRGPKLEELALGIGPHLPFRLIPWAHYPLKSLPPSLFLKLSQNSSQEFPASRQTPRLWRTCMRRPLPAPFQLCLPLTPYWHTHSPSTGLGMWAGAGEEPESE